MKIGKILPWVAIAGAAYYLYSKKHKTGSPYSIFNSGPFAQGTVSSSLSTQPPAGFRLKYASSRPVGAYFTGKTRVSPAPFGAVNASPQYFAEIMLANRQYDWVEVVRG